MVLVGFVRFSGLIRHATRFCSSNGSDSRGQNIKHSRSLKISKWSLAGRQKFRTCSLSAAISPKVFTLGKRDSTF